MRRLLTEGLGEAGAKAPSSWDAVIPGLKAGASTGRAARDLMRVAAQDDKLREECGVVAIHGHPDAARQVYLGLYALQHRGQESAGIATADGTHLSNIKGWGWFRRFSPMR